MVRSTVDFFEEPNTISGWVYENGETVEIEVEAKGEIIGRGHNTQRRDDLERAQLGSCAFTIVTSASFTFFDVVSGSVKVFYKTNEERREIVLRADVILTLKFRVLSSIMRDINEMTPEQVEMYLYNERKNVNPEIYYAEMAAVSSLKNSILRFNENVPITKMVSPFYVKVGTLSPDLQCEVGRDGHLFLTRGSNNVLAIYEPSYDSEEIDNRSTEWLDLLRHRQRICETVGSGFIQVVIPDKISVLREKFDGVGSALSPILYSLERKIDRDSVSKSYVSGLRSIKKVGFGNAFRKIDTHFTPEGGWAVFSDICRRISPSYIVPTQFDIEYITDGDIGKRFFGHDLYEICKSSAHPKFHGSRKVIQKLDPDQGRFTGGRIVFQNHDAPFPEKVIGFGNSFMNDYISQASLGYWLSTYFAEFHLITGAEMDKKYIEEVRPDFVLCQTVERFLAYVPAV